MKGYEIRFNIYAESEQEVEMARRAIVEFISDNAQQGRAVTAKKIADIIPQWKGNSLIYQRIVNYFK